MQQSALEARDLANKEIVCKLQFTRRSLCGWAQYFICFVYAHIAHLASLSCCKFTSHWAQIGMLNYVKCKIKHAVVFFPDPHSQTAICSHWRMLKRASETSVNCRPLFEVWLEAKGRKNNSIVTAVAGARGTKKSIIHPATKNDLG